MLDIINGDAVVQLEFQHVTMMSMDCYLENITYYDSTGDEVSAKIIEEFTEESYLYAPANLPKIVEVPIENKRDYTVRNATALDSVSSADGGVEDKATLVVERDGDTFILVGRRICSNNRRRQQRR